MLASAFAPLSARKRSHQDNDLRSPITTTTIPSTTIPRTAEHDFYVASFRNVSTINVAALGPYFWLQTEVPYKTLAAKAPDNDPASSYFGPLKIGLPHVVQQRVSLFGGLV